MGIETFIILILASGFGFYMAWNIGANDVANAMGTSVGSRALTLKQAVIVATVFEFAGAFFVGSHVTETIRKEMIDLSVFEGRIDILMYGMLASLLAAGVWLQVATYFGWPVSTTHSIIGAIVGFGIVGGGVTAISWGQIGTIVMSWVVSPLLSGTIAFIIFSLIRRTMINVPHPVQATKRWSPVFIFLVFSVLTLATLFKGLKNLNLDLSFSHALIYAVGVGLAASAIGGILIRRIHVPSDGETTVDFSLMSMSMDLRAMVRHTNRVRALATKETKEYLENIQENLESLMKMVRQSEAKIHMRADFRFVESVFGYLQILSACFVAFAHGANDVANAIGPVAAVFSLIGGGTKVLTAETEVPIWILALGGAGIVIGLATWGWRVIETVGKRITELTPSRGFAAELAAATTIVFASKLGLPISTTHTLVGAVMGVGFARGIDSLNPRVIRDIISSWIITLPAGAGMAIVFFFILKAIFAG